jgi:protein-L-isoaspartate(D-aspartate) O-methyltransferase
MKALFSILLILWMSRPGFSQDYEELRHKMVREQIENRGIYHRATLKAMRKVERHLFVPPKFQPHAYDDSPLLIGYNQTISQPYIVAYMTQLMQPKESHRILEVGAGSGYQAAILAEIVDKVYTIEIVKELGDRAKKLLPRLGYNNVEVIIGDGYQGLESQAPFDGIIVTAAADQIPPPLIKQLKEGGRMVIPIGSPSSVQMLMLVTKRNGKVMTRELSPVRFVPFTRDKD